MSICPQMSKNGLIKRPTMLDSTYFEEWKYYMRVLIRLEDRQLWDIIENGPLKITKRNRANWDEDDYNKCSKNARALHILYCALPIDEFYRVSTCKTAKQVWDALNDAYQDAALEAMELANIFRNTSLEETSIEPTRKTEEGHSTKTPILLSSGSAHFHQWKARMRAYIDSIDPQLWYIIENGPLKITKVNDDGVQVEKHKHEWDNYDYNKCSQNAGAVLVIISGLKEEVFRTVARYKTAKEMWDALTARYEGPEESKQYNISLLEHEYELFRMNEGESIKEMFSRFATIVGKLALLGEQVSVRAQFRKILRSLPQDQEEYEMFVNAIQLTNFVVEMSLGELYTRLLALERQHASSKSRRR